MSGASKQGQVGVGKNSRGLTGTRHLTPTLFSNSRGLNETRLHLPRSRGCLACHNSADFYVIEGRNLSAADIKGVTVMSLITAALLFSLAYAPSLFWLRKRLGGCRPAAVFPLASALVLNLPVFLIGILAIGRTLAPTEAFAFIGAFVLMGTAFGLGFVWNYQDRTI